MKPLQEYTINCEPSLGQKDFETFLKKFLQTKIIRHLQASKTMQRDEAPPHFHWRACENFVLMMIIQTMVSLTLSYLYLNCWTWFSTFKSMHGWWICRQNMLFSHLNLLVGWSSSANSAVLNFKKLDKFSTPSILSYFSMSKLSKFF